MKEHCVLQLDFAATRQQTHRRAGSFDKRDYFICVCRGHNSTEQDGRTHEQSSSPDNDDER